MEYPVPTTAICVMLNFFEPRLESVSVPLEVFPTFTAPKLSAAGATFSCAMWRNRLDRVDPAFRSLLSIALMEAGCTCRVGIAMIAAVGITATPLAAGESESWVCESVCELLSACAEFWVSDCGAAFAEALVKSSESSSSSDARRREIDTGCFSLDVNMRGE